MGLGATVNHSVNFNNGQLAIPESLDDGQEGPRGRLNSTSQGADVPEFQPSDGCDRSNCTEECYR